MYQAMSGAQIHGPFQEACCRGTERVGVWVGGESREDEAEKLEFAQADVFTPIPAGGTLAAASSPIYSA